MIPVLALVREAQQISRVGDAQAALVDGAAAGQREAGLLGAQDGQAAVPGAPPRKPASRQASFSTAARVRSFSGQSARESTSTNSGRRWPAISASSRPSCWASRWAARVQNRSMGLVWQAIDFDLVPCWADGGAGVLRLPDLGRSRWLRTNPTEHYTLLQAADRSCNQRLLPLIRGVRAWRRHVRLPLRSFHLESMLVGAFNSPPRTWAEGIQLAFSRLAGRARRPFADPTGEGATVDEGLSDADRS